MQCHISKPINQAELKDLIILHCLNSNQYDTSENIMLAGSDSAEIWKGKDQIKGHVSEVFAHTSSRV